MKKKHLILTTLIYLLFNACSSEQLVENNQENNEYNTNGQLLEAVIDEVNFFEVFLYDNENKPLARILNIPIRHYPESYNNLFNQRLLTKNIHYYVYNNSNKVVETRAFFGGLFFFENNRVYSINESTNEILDITDIRTRYELIKHTYDNNNRVNSLSSFLNNGNPNVYLEYKYNNQEQIKSLYINYISNGSEESFTEYTYFDREIKITSVNFDGDFNEVYVTHNNVLNPYNKLFVDFGIGTTFGISSSIGKSFYPAFTIPIKYFFGSKNEVQEINDFNYPKKTLHKSLPTPRVNYTELTYTYR